VAVAELDARDSDWRSGPGYEGVSVTRPDGSTRPDVYIGADVGTLEAARPAPGPTLDLTDGTTRPLYEEGAEESTTVDGRPGTLQRVTASDPATAPPRSEIAGITLPQSFDTPTWVLRWQPVDGLHAIVQVHDGDRDLVYEAAGALRLDRAQRCAMPFRLAAGVVDAEWTECRTALRHDPAGDGVTWLLSSITLTGGGDEVLVYMEAAELAGHPADPPVTPNRTVAGLPAWWSTDNPAGLYLPEFGPASVFVSGTGEAEAAALVENLAVVGELDRPETWPERAVG
jgi:hypothetical protein